MYSVAMNWKPTQPPNSVIAPRFARTRDEERRIPSRTSGVAVRCSCRTNNPKIATTAASDRSVRADAHPAVGASTSVNTSRSIPPVIATAPARSNPFLKRETRPLSGTSRIPASSVSTATGTGRKKTQRQPISVSRPPKTSPSENPVAPVAV